MKNLNLFGKLLFALALAITFSCSQAFAAESIQVYDNDEKSFVAMYNQIAAKENLFTLEATPQFVENRGETQVYKSNSVPSDANVKALFIKNSNGAVDSVSISAKSMDKFQEALTISLMIVGLSGDEIKTLVANQKENSASVWGEAIQRNIHIEFFATTESVDVVIDATK